VREQKLETALPNPPKITSGEVVAHKTREFVPRDRVGARSGPRSERTPAPAQAFLTF
jgi:hypothetical protein